MEFLTLTPLNTFKMFTVYRVPGFLMLHQYLTPLMFLWSNSHRYLQQRTQIQRTALPKVWLTVTAKGAFIGRMGCSTSTRFVRLSDHFDTINMSEAHSCFLFDCVVSTKIIKTYTVLLYIIVASNIRTTHLLHSLKLKKKPNSTNNNDNQKVYF